MDIVEAIKTRKSIRAFKPDPVPQAILKDILEAALRAPSWTNTQPWEFAIATGNKLQEIQKGLLDKVDEEPNPDIIHPQGYPEPYDSRRSELARMELDLKGIKREDRKGRGWWRLQNLKNYGAPAVIYILIDRSFYFQGEGVNVWPLFDCGSVAENIMLLAVNHGLGTVAQAMAVSYPGVVRRVLGIPDSKLILLAIAIGHPDWDDAITQLRSNREQLDKIAKWHGFD